jgi:hypothetical protein
VLRRWGWPLTVGVGSAFLLGMLTGAVIVDTPDPNASRTALGTGLLTYCVASGTLVTTLTKPSSGRAFLTVGLEFLAALAAGTLGVTAGVLFLVGAPGHHPDDPRGHSAGLGTMNGYTCHTGPWENPGNPGDPVYAPNAHVTRLLEERSCVTTGPTSPS